MAKHGRVRGISLCINVTKLHMKRNYPKMNSDDLAAKLEHPSIATYFTGNGHRIASFRTLLDMLNIPLPTWAARGISGIGPARRDAVAAYQADNPQPRPLVLADRKTNATPERIQAAKATKQRRLSGLYDQTFPQ